MNSKIEKTRDYSLDNIRFFLIFFVVFAHFIEVCVPFLYSWRIYKLIYTFHMPAFIFLFGYNVRYSPNRIVFRWCIPYIVFQTIYIAFTKFVLKTDINFQYATPHWMLWYMIVCIFYQLLLPMYETSDKRRQILSLLCVFAISLIVGFDNSFGYYVTLSRFFVFQPWFLLGYYCKRNRSLEALSAPCKKHTILLFISALIIALSVLFLHFVKLPVGLLAGASPYSYCNSTVWMRAIVFLIAFFWIVFLFAGIKTYLNRRLFLITRIGQNTWPVFLLHGLFLRAIAVYCPWMLSSPWLVLAVTLALLVLLGNKLFSKAIYFISFSWMEKFFPDTGKNQN